MARDQIRYDLLTQDALRSVIRKVLADAVRDGLPGDHHFYISFRTTDPGVKLSPRLRNSYPDEMTVILQHQFWDLQVTDQAFEVGLAFGGVPERLVVPFASITGFFDPSVEFGVKFEVGSEDGEDAATATVRNPEGAEIMTLAEPGRDKPPAAVQDGTEALQPGSPDTPAGSGEIVRLDQFRKKT